MVKSDLVIGITKKNSDYYTLYVRKFNILFKSVIHRKKYRIAKNKLNLYIIVINHLSQSK